MINYQIVLSQEADKNLRNIFLNIASNLHSPENARRLWKEMKSLLLMYMIGIYNKKMGKIIF